MEDELTLDMRTKAARLLDLTQAMLKAAESGGWDEFELQEQQRSAMLKLVFDDQAIEEAVKRQLIDIIKEIQLIDETIINLIRQQRDQAAEELRHLKHARESDKAYRATADDSL